MLGVPNRSAHLHKLLDRSLDLVVENASVCHHNDGVEDLLVIALQTDQLMRQPGD